MKISIVTPSFRQSAWLKLCIASVADQADVDVEHIVQDAGSDDGTLDWLPGDTRVRAFVEKDDGMYDAVNRGYRRATGEILAYLNCDEQYLPGALKAVHDYFAAHPKVDVLVADSLIVDLHGNYICHRHGLPPGRNTAWVRTSVLTCSLFLRRRVLTEREHFFDTQWRDLGDAVWLLRAAQKGLVFGQSRVITSAFGVTGENMNWKPNAALERARFEAMAPRWIQKLRPVLAVFFKLRILASGAFWRRPFCYAIYTLDNPATRQEFQAAHPTPLWRQSARTNA